MTSIRRDLLRTLLPGLIVLYAAAAGFFYGYARHSLVKQFDEALEAETRNLAGMCEVEGEDGDLRVEIEFEEFVLPEFQPSRSAAYYQIRGSDGRSLARSPSLGDGDLLLPLHSGTKFGIADLELPDGRRGRACGLRFTPGPEDGEQDPALDPRAGLGEIHLVVARSREGIDRTLGVLATGLVLAGALILGGSTLLVTWRVNRALAPVDRIARRTASLGPDDLGYRFPTDGVPRELQPICDRLNDLFERIGAAITRERRFSADVAHELRTPIAELRALADVGLQWSPGKLPEDDPRRYFSDGLDIAKQMERRVSMLLELVRSESGQRKVELREVDLQGLVAKTWERLAGEAEGKSLDCRFRLPGQLTVRTDEEMLGMVLRNLLENAVDHTPPGGSIECELVQDGDEYRFHLSNTNPGLEPEDMQHIAEPFWRKDPARTDGRHAGLGLSVVKAGAGLLGAQIQVILPDGETFRVELRGKLTPEYSVPGQQGR